ncbi:hypothetical protein XA68_14672 [Ophiocordyceps unilateralis]|uniref:Major facilitator superfamily (MFS) profile domain-containing protein n=1 Tax=Ophiocordyceps unilateralis TaxID=268505 RepID=A0A2A9P8F9_OPHUN|nr:hypothetical protein XA68_14672 [Ophiocordyceps unilateralis]
MTADEGTPLLPQRSKRLQWPRLASVENRILLASFLITLSFSYTQVPLVYVFRLMECEAFYGVRHPADDRCSRDEIAAGTATQYSILGMSTTLCGTVNLFIAGQLVRRFGPRLALLMQTLVPALRVATQLLGVRAGGREGMMIIQATQLITVFGGPAGYILVVNVFAAEVVEPERRTAVFGKLQGCIMLGQGLGYLIGGIIGDAVDIRAPFDVAFVTFLVAALYARFALPFLAPDAVADGKRPRRRRRRALAGFLAPLRILAPQRLRLRHRRREKSHYGVIFLCCGIFIGVVATGYAPFLIQLYATAVFDFNQADNGWLMAEFALMRALFLVLGFPSIIAAGRRWIISSEADRRSPTALVSPSSPAHVDAAAEGEGERQETTSNELDHGPVGCHFDLVFLRWSLVLDGSLTAMTAFATRPWHIYLAACLLPLGSGSAPAAKGVITEMCTESQRADALNAVTLVENVARLATQGLFGFVFASLASVGKAYATFFFNAAIAIVAMAVLLLSSFPPRGSSLIDVDQVLDIDRGA